MNQYKVGVEGDFGCIEFTLYADSFEVAWLYAKKHAEVFSSEVRYVIQSVIQEREDG